MKYLIPFLFACSSVPTRTGTTERIPLLTDIPSCNQYLRGMTKLVNEMELARDVKAPHFREVLEKNRKNWNENLNDPELDKVCRIGVEGLVYYVSIED